jgi:hypothetical protein
MVLDHLAAILLFSGPLFYIGLWMVVDPAGIARLLELLVRVLTNLTSGGLRSGEIRESENSAISRPVRTALRFAGVALLLIAVVA